jgi:Beta-propeller repeat
MKTPLLQSVHALMIAGLLLARPVEAQLPWPNFPWSTFLGGTADDRTYAVARDTAGFVYVAGHTLSTPSTTNPTVFPAVTPGVYTFLPPGPTGWNLFICKLTPVGSQLVWSTIIGGSDDDEAFDVALDSLGNVVVAGRTNSSDFPVASAYQSTLSGMSDAFVLKLSPNGSVLHYSTFFGGTDDDYALAVRADSWNGLLTIAGYTKSANMPTNNAFQPTFAGVQDAFVARVDATPGAGGLVYSTFLGGVATDGRPIPNPATDVEKSLDLHVDSLGVITIAGAASSSNFPVTIANAYQPTSAGGFEAFVATIDPSLAPASQLTYSTFLGGNSADFATSVDRMGSRVIVGGYTRSSSFPVTPGAYDVNFNGTPGTDLDMFVCVLDLSKPPANQLIYSTFIGGVSAEKLETLSVDTSGAIAFGGYSRSSFFPTTSGALPIPPPPSPSYAKAVIGRLNPAGSGTCDLEYSTFLGGTAGEQVTDLSLHPNLGVHVAGVTLSSNFQVSTGAYQLNHGGARDAWTAQLDLLPSGNLPGGAYFGALRYGWGTPSANAGGPVMMVGDGPAPGSSCFSVICRRAPANASGFLGLTYDVAAVNTALPAPFLVGGAAVWLDLAHPTFTLMPVGPISPLGGCVVPFPLTGLPASLGLQVVTQFGWIDPLTLLLSTSDVLRIYI